MQTPTPLFGESPVLPAAADRPQIDDFLQRHPHYQFLPLLEGVAVRSPNAYEAFSTR